MQNHISSRQKQVTEIKQSFDELRRCVERDMRVNRYPEVREVLIDAIEWRKNMELLKI